MYYDYIIFIYTTTYITEYYYYIILFCDYTIEYRQLKVIIVNNSDEIIISTYKI